MMFWKRWFGYESLKLDSAPMWPVDVGKPVISKLKTEIISLKSQLEYQTELAKSFRDRVHELEKQVTDKADLGNLYKLAADGYLADIARLETQIAKLTAERDGVIEAYERLYGKLSDLLCAEDGIDYGDDDEPETDEPDADSHLPTLSSLAGIGIETPDSEETKVFESRGYGEQ